MNIVFWGSSDFSIPSLEALYNTHNITAIVTNADNCCGRGMKEIRMTPVKKFALEHNIPTIQPCNLRDNSFFSELIQYQADIYVIVSYGMIIPEPVIYYPKYKSINLHASLLPKYRGASPIQSAIAHGEIKTGNTVQYITKEMDKGDIILQKELPIDPTDIYSTLSQKMAEDGAALLLKALEQIKIEAEVLKPQNDMEATYTKLIKKENGKVSFIDNTSTEIYNMWRAYNPWPGIYTDYANTENRQEIQKSGIVVQLKEISVFPDNYPVAGLIIQSDKQNLVVSCKEGSLKLMKLKPSGKNEMDFVSFINGYKPVTGRFF